MIVLIYQIICYEPIVENFNLDYNLIKETILNNYKNSITFNGKPSLVQFKNEISNILNDFEIERIDFFLKYIEEGKQYLLEITFVINDIVKKYFFHHPSLFLETGMIFFISKNFLLTVSTSIVEMSITIESFNFMILSLIISGGVIE